MNEKELTLEDFQAQVAKEYLNGTKLVTGHRKAYFDEATRRYVEYKLKQIANPKN